MTSSFLAEADLCVESARIRSREGYVHLTEANEEYLQIRIGWEEVAGTGEDAPLVLNEECGTSGKPGQES